jgi:signal transduction histidine kinase
MFANIFKNKKITTIYIWGMFVILIFVLLFALLLINDEYNDFDKEAISIRKEYTEEQKSTIVFDTNRVLKFISHAYENNIKTLDEVYLKSQVLNAIEQLYGRQDGTGYIFIYDFKGTNLSDPLRLNNIGKNLYDFKDSNGVEVIKDLIDISQKTNGGFVEYMWTKPVTEIETSKISYAKAFIPWGWMVGTGVYLDEVEKLISAKKADLKNRLIKYMMEILSLTVILFGIGLTGLGVVNHLIGREIDSFSRFFKKAAKSHTTIDVDQIQLIEFKKMVKYINEMVDTIHKRKEKLKEVNLTLEKRVEQKTKDLSEQNSLLEKEKAFSDSLVKAQDSFIKHSIHEINTPLAVIMTHIDLFKMKEGENRYLSKIEAASKIISNIYSDLSYMVKKDRFVYEKKQLNISMFLEDRIDFFSEIALGNRHNIISEIQDDIWLYFSEEELQRIIDNNLSNAIKYANKGTEVKVSLMQEKEKVVLKFLSISPKIEDTEGIFNAFKREDDVKGGFGLGLEIVYTICKKENIEIEVQSDNDMTVFSYRFQRSIG